MVTVKEKVSQESPAEASSGQKVVHDIRRTTRRGLEQNFPSFQQSGTV
jgi:hypothetical protein